MAHTEGPWELCEFDGPVDNLMGASFAIRAPGAPGGIAHTIGGLGDEEKGNAQLITAAPELLDTLKAMERIVVELYPGDVEPEPEHLGEYQAVWGAVSDARAAIAKATR